MMTNHALPRYSRWVPWIMAVALTLNVVLAVAQSENSAASRNPTWDFTALAKVPAKAQARRNPLAGDPDAVAAGDKLFAEHCSSCHGKDAMGKRRGPSMHDAAVREASPGTLFFILTNGVIRHGMPGWSKLPEPERWQLVSFLKSLHEEHGP